MATSGRSMVSVVAACCVLAEAALGVAAPGEAVVRPGGLVRWSGEGTQVCTLEGKSWEPIGSTCVYPIDLLTPEGAVVLCFEAFPPPAGFGRYLSW